MQYKNTLLDIWFFSIKSDFLECKEAIEGVSFLVHLDWYHISFLVYTALEFY